MTPVGAPINAAELNGAADSFQTSAAQSSEA